MITNPTPQRALRGHRPRRPAPRAAATGEYVARLATRLTARDRWLARMLYEHKVLTSTQIAAMAWPSLRATNMRLRELYLWRVIDRFQPYVTSGTAPMHYVLDVAGATILAHEDGLELRDLNYRHERAIGIAHSLRLAHTVGANSFFTDLIASSRRPRAAGQLTAWWSEARCGRHFGDIVRPDAYGRWREGGCEFEWFLEFDFGTEQPDRVAAKLPGYARLAATTGITTPVLIRLPTARREANVRRALATALDSADDPTLVPVATSSAGSSASGTDAAGARWLPLDAQPQPFGRRRHLIELTEAWPYLAPLRASAEATHDDRYGLLPPSPLPPAPSSRRPGR